MPKLLVVFAALALCPSLTQAQQSTPPDVLSALLAEVRQLRAAMERAATVTPQIQILGSRLTVQNERLSRAARDLEAVRAEIERVVTGAASATAQAQEVEEQASSRDADPRQRQYADLLKQLKRQIGEATAHEQRLRAREAELAGVLVAEELQWTDLNRRLDDLERSLTSVRQPR